MVSIRDYSTTAASNTSLFPEGMAPGTVNNSAREVQAELAKLQADFGGTLTTGGTTTAYTLTLTTAPAALTDGLAFAFTANATNAAGPVTLVVTPAGGAAFASKKIKSYATGAVADPAAGEMVAGGHYEVQYDSAADTGTGAYILKTPNMIRGSSLTPQGYLKLPGIILQWGTEVFSSASVTIVPFPTSFLSAVYSVQLTHNFISTVGASPRSITINGFNIELSSSSSGTVYWFAVGK